MIILLGAAFIFWARKTGFTAKRIWAQDCRISRYLCSRAAGYTFIEHCIECYKSCGPKTPSYTQPVATTTAVSLSPRAVVAHFRGFGGRQIRQRAGFCVFGEDLSGFGEALSGLAKPYSVFGRDSSPNTRRRGAARPSNRSGGRSCTKDTDPFGYWSVFSPTTSAFRTPRGCLETRRRRASPRTPWRPCARRTR
mgnify:CR=1 FL=1